MKDDCVLWQCVLDAVELSLQSADASLVGVVDKRTLFPRYCKLCRASENSISCRQCSLLPLLAQTRSVKRSSLVIAGPQAEKSMCLKVGFIVRSAVSLM